MPTDTPTSADTAAPHGDRYPTLEELADTAHLLAARHPRLCHVRTIGTSRAGRPLLLLSIGHGDDNILVLAGAHADEFSGRAGIVELAHRILARPALHTQATWNLLLCLDPDGAHLAEGAATARTLPAHFAGYFRPDAGEQPEWAPAIGGQLPESRALLDLIDELRPSLQFSLHNTDIGGTFVQATCDLPHLAEPFAASAAHLGIPVETGSYDTFWLRTSGPGIFTMEPRHIDRQETSTGMLAPHHPHPQDDTAGGRPTWFAPQRHGGQTLVIEVPAWTSDHLGNTDPAGPDTPERLAASADLLRTRERLLTELADQARPHLDDTALLRAARTPLTAARQLADTWDPRTGGHHLLTPVTMTRAKLTGIELWAHRLPLRAAALLRRAIATQTPTTPGTDRLDLLLDHWCAQYQQRFHPVRLPVTHQAAHHANTVLAAARPARRPE